MKVSFDSESWIITDAGLSEIPKLYHQTRTVEIFANRLILTIGVMPSSVTFVNKVSGLKFLRISSSEYKSSDSSKKFIN